MQWTLASSTPSPVATGNVSPVDAAQILDFEVLNLKGSTTDFEIQPVDLEPGLKWLGFERKKNGVTGKLRLNVWETERDDAGFFRVAATFAIDGSGKERRLHMVAASGRLMPWIDVSPKIVNVGRVRAGQTLSRQIHFESRKSGPVSLGIAQPEYLSAKVDQQYADVTFTAPSAPKVFRTSLLLVVGSESVSIPITGMLALKSADDIE